MSDKALAEIAQSKLDEYFNPAETEYRLRQTHDPETGSNGLMLEIHTQLDGKAAMDTLRRFEDDWWLDNMSPDSRLIIDVMFA